MDIWSSRVSARFYVNLFDGASTMTLSLVLAMRRILSVHRLGGMTGRFLQYRG